MKTSTCPDALCEHRNSFGYCSLNGGCVYRNFETTSAVHEFNPKLKSIAEYPGCDFCKFDLEDGDYLYQHTSSDHAIIYEEVVVHYCPVCGRKLKGD